MKTSGNLEDTALGVAGLMLLEAIGLQVAHSETLGVVIAIFATTLFASVAKRMLGDTNR
jgi:threonine/homoserine efflux transporter RhtA